MDGQARLRVQPLADYVLEKFEQDERIFADETLTLPAGSGKSQKGLGCGPMRGGQAARRQRSADGGLPLEECRGGECIERHLAGFASILHVDGYTTYNRPVRSAGANERVMDSTSFWRRLPNSGPL